MRRVEERGSARQCEKGGVSVHTTKLEGRNSEASHQVFKCRAPVRYEESSHRLLRKRRDWRQLCYSEWHHARKFWVAVLTIPCYVPLASTIEQSSLNCQSLLPP